MRSDDTDLERSQQLKDAIQNNAAFSTSFCCDKLPERTPTLSHDMCNDICSEVGRLSDRHMPTSDIRQTPKTSLSPHVLYLFTRSVPQSVPPYLPNILTDDCTLEWSVIALPGV